MVRVPLAEEAPSSRRATKKHAVTAWVWRAIGHAMLHRMNVHSRPKRPRNTLLLGALHNLVHREIGIFGVFPMQQYSSDPNLVCHLQPCTDGNCFHYFVPFTNYYFPMFLRIIKNFINACA